MTTTNTFSDFSHLGLTQLSQEAVASLGFTIPTPIQTQVIPAGLAGNDILAAAQTGTGKTLAYLLPIFDQLVRFYGSKRPKKNTGPYALILAPTRELAQQISECAATLGHVTRFRTLTIIGGKKYAAQRKRLHNGCDILIATPGRLADLIEHQAVSLQNVHYLVLDEVDRMTDMGFWPSVYSLIRQTSPKRQTFLLSATLTSDVQNKAHMLQTDPTVIEIARQGETAPTVCEYMLPVALNQKQDLLVALLQHEGSNRVIVFTPTKIEADSCARKLQTIGINATSIHADKTQGQRDKALKDFRNDVISVLVATDILARGIDITDVSYVVNYTVPKTPEDYIHRIGRTGRADKSGAAYTFLSPDQILDLREIEYHTHQLLQTYDVPGFDYACERLVPSPKRPTKRTPSRGRRRPSLRSR